MTLELRKRRAESPEGNGEAPVMDGRMTDKEADKPKPYVDDIMDAPALIRPLVMVYRWIPSLIVLPFFKFDITFTFVAYCFLHMVRVLSAPVVTELWGWPEGHKDTSSTVGSMVSFVHCAVLLPGLMTCLLTQPFRPSRKMSDSPQWWQDAASALIQYCMGYMMCDTVFTFLIVNYKPGQGIILSFSDWLFLGHHFATFTYMLSCLMNGAGHMSAMALMFDGEVTNPIFNVFIMTTNAVKIGCCGATPALLDFVGVIYSAEYIIARLVVGPPLCLYITYDLLFNREGRKNVNLGLAIYWLLLMWGVTLGSKGWIDQALLMFETFLAGGSISELGIDITATHDN